jgi:hypothetical protein
MAAVADIVDIASPVVALYVIKIDARAVVSAYMAFHPCEEGPMVAMLVITMFIILGVACLHTLSIRGGDG